MIASQTKVPAVVLVHGIGAHKIVMWPLKRSLERSGFATFNFGYSSFQSIPTSAAKLDAFLRQLQEEEKFSTIDLVAHSMGCIVSRYALGQYKPESFRRMVMLTPPSKGTPVADRVAPYLGWCVPAINELRTDSTSLVNSLPPPAYPFALVQATWDFLIPASHVGLEGAQELAQVHTMHSLVLFHRPTHLRVVNFLKSGSFEGK